MFLFLFHTLQDLTPLKDLSKGFASVESAAKESIFELFIFAVSDLNKYKKKENKFLKNYIRLQKSAITKTSMKSLFNRHL